MLNIGVSFFHYGFKVAVLSQGFATIDEKMFRNGQIERFEPWIDDIKSAPDELVHWFISEKDFYNSDYPTESFSFDDEYNSLFLG